MLATARLRLTPQQVMRLTMYQLLLMLDGVAMYHDEPRQIFTAAMTANLMNMMRARDTKPFTAARLLGREEEAGEVSEWTEEDFDRVRQFGAEC